MRIAGLFNNFIAVKAPVNAPHCGKNLSKIGYKTPVKPRDIPWGTFVATVKALSIHPRLR